ncbi:MAG: ATP-dependent RecD-like DNA helicase, partial [Oscillospiraceae bacterium]|nr:ATP-dependent RecD-like DNA helicase [Oscillospiraceae bacterium]
ELTAQLCAERLPKAYGFDALRDIQVLCPSRKGETGTMKLNERLQAILNPKQRPGAAAPRREVQIGRQLFREGDKVMQIKNNYDLSWKRPDEAESGSGIYNGDIGFIEKVNPAAGLFKIRFDDERLAEYPFESAEELEHAYAITVHKSQGSEFNAVILPVLGIAELLAYRNLLYTAVTRARKLLILVGSQGQVRRMVENASRARRYSGLAGFLAEMVHGDVALPPQDS